MEIFDSIIIGAGQAGLAMSAGLRMRGIRHVVLERGRVAQRWRTERWDSFRLLSPNWQTRLPGHHYRDGDPDGFMTGRQVVALLERYAAPAPVRTGVNVSRVTRADRGYQVVTSEGELWCRNVVVATGDLDRLLLVDGSNKNAVPDRRIAVRPGRAVRPERGPRRRDGGSGRASAGPGWGPAAWPVDRLCR